MKTCEILMLKDDSPKAFLPYRITEKLGGVNLGEYETVYTCLIDDEATPETVFEMLNINHPNDYHNRSLSVSDIVVIDGETLFCDSFGFRPL